MTRVKELLADFVRTDGSDLPLPGSGATWRRLDVLSTWAARDLSVGRLAEGHVDALAILAEAGMEPLGDSATYGVWAARSRSSTPRFGEASSISIFTPLIESPPRSYSTALRNKTK